MIQDHAGGTSNAVLIMPFEPMLTPAGLHLKQRTAVPAQPCTPR